MFLFSHSQNQQAVPDITLYIKCLGCTMCVLWGAPSAAVTAVSSEAEQISDQQSPNMGPSWGSGGMLDMHTHCV